VEQGAEAAGPAGDCVARSKMREAIIKRAYAAFRADIEAMPALTLRGANALDSGDSAPPYDAVVDQPTDTYLSTHAYWGLIYLDARSQQTTTRSRILEKGL
jgi:hypothetical protein